jgi:hypothetical protein
LISGEVYKNGRKGGTISPNQGVPEVSAKSSGYARGWETNCQTYDFEFLECYTYGYDYGEGVIMQDYEYCFTTTISEYICLEEWVDDEEEPVACNLCGSTSCNGGCGGSEHGDGNGTPLVQDSRFSFSSEMTNEQREEVIAIMKGINNPKISESLKGNPVNIRINPSLGTPGEYNAKSDKPNSNTIVLKETRDLDPRTVREEFFHAYQDRYYSGGTYQYRGDRRSSSVEFEAKVFCDILRGLEDGFFSTTMTINNDNEDIYLAYMKWLNDATDFFGDIPDKNHLYERYEEMLGFFHENCEVTGL